MRDLEQLTNFIKFTHDIRRVRRAILLDNEQQENDAEHCYQMAMVAWFIIDSNNLDLDKYKCVGMALVHDVIEVYAGDLIAFAGSKALEDKLVREAEAVKKLKKEWPSFISLNQLVEEYEALKTPEAKFVYALDKFLPTVNNYLFEGVAWKKHGISLGRMKEIKVGKIDLDEVINDYYQQHLKVLEANPQIFGKKD